jgi:hypothetical protein
MKMDSSEDIFGPFDLEKSTAQKISTYGFM